MHNKRNHAGYVYIAEFGPRHVKIGKSRNPVRRMTTLSNQSGVKITRNWVSPACYNYGEIERELHEKFEKHRGIGEYFNLGFDSAVGSMRTSHFDLKNEERDAVLDREYSDRATLSSAVFVEILTGASDAGKSQPALPLPPVQIGAQVIAEMMKVAELLEVPRLFAVQVATEEAVRQSGMPEWAQLATQAACKD